MDFPNDRLSRAHHLLASALQLLDEANASADIGGHVDQAMVRLSEVMKEAGRIEPLKAKLEKFSRGSDATN
jgi:hypothetical protein